MLSYILSFFRKQEKFQVDEDPATVKLTQEQSKLPGEYKLYRPEQDPRFSTLFELTRKERGTDEAPDMIRENANKLGNGISLAPRMVPEDTRNHVRDNFCGNHR